MTSLNKPTDHTQLDIPTDILCSYFYFKNVDIAEIHSWGTRIIGDSGAFSAMTTGRPVDRESFHEWVYRWKDSLFWAASLDVIGDSEGTHSNWLAARRDGLELVPTLHYGADPREMDRYVSEGASLIGLGGMVPYTSEKDRLMRWCLSMHRYARDTHPGVRFHGWGITHPYLLDNLPWWSTDSSGYASCFIFGTLRLWIPERAKFQSIDLNGRDIAKYHRVLRKHYNVDWKLISESLPTNRRELGRVAIRSLQIYAKWLQSRQKVSAPELLSEKGLGPLHHAVYTATGNVWATLYAKELNREKRESKDPVITSAIGPTDVHILLSKEEGPHVVAVLGSKGSGQWYALNEPKKKESEDV